MEWFLVQSVVFFILINAPCTPPRPPLLPLLPLIPFADPNLSLDEKAIKEAACAAKEEDVFKNVQGIDKDMDFDQDRYEREKTNAAADKMAERFEQCDMDAHRNFKHNATQLDAAVDKCVNDGIKEYKRLTGETVDESDVLEFNEQAATKQMGDLLNHERDLIISKCSPVVKAILTQNINVLSVSSRNCVFSIRLVHETCKST